MTNPFAGVRWIWKNGQLIDFEKATVHVLSHALHYGSGVFEGIRCYNTLQGSAVFRLRRARPAPGELGQGVPHADRLHHRRADRGDLRDDPRQRARRRCYIRPIVFRGFGNTIGVNPLHNPVEVFIACWPWGKYLGEEADKGVDVCVSSWRRIAADSMPAVAKATGNYLNGQLIKIEAVTNGYAEGIALDARGFVSEGSGENVFMVQDGVLLTPPLAASVLQGITRDTVVKIARDLGIPVREEQIPRGQLYTCDELFMTGTAAEITPIRWRRPQPGRPRLPGRDHPAHHGRVQGDHHAARSRTATAGCTRSITVEARVPETTAAAPQVR